MPRPTHSTWKWTLTILAIAAAAPLLLRNTTTAAAPPGGIPDSGAQLQAVVDQLKTTNDKLDALQKLFESGKVQVQATVLNKDGK